MARTGKLAAVEVTKAQGPAVLHDGGGLYLRISATGSKAWVFRYQLDGRRRDMGLGPFPEITLAEARAKAMAHRRQRYEGSDPLVLRTAQRAMSRLSAAKGRTFKQCALDFIDKNKAAWRNLKHRQQWENTLASYVYPVLGELAVSDIDTGLVVQVLEPIWIEKPETASRVRGRIEAVLDSATARGFRTGPNPAQWKGSLAHILPARAKVRRVAHHPALAYIDLPLFLAELRERDGLAALALKFTILTAARTNEVLGAKWNEIDLDAKIWSVSAERMKAGRDHRVPLSGAALAVLDLVRPLTAQNDGTPNPVAPIFPGSRRALPLSQMSMLMLLRRMGKGDLTAHGFRSSFRDWAAEQTAYPSEVIEMALAHAVGNKVEQAYRRSDLFERRRSLMADWAQFCNGQPSEPITPFRAVARP